MSEFRPGLSLPLPAVILAVLLGGGLGAGIGFAAHAMLAKPEPPPPPTVEIVKQELSAEEIASLCKDEVEPERKALLQAHERVKSLESDIAAREKEIADYKAKAEKDAAGREAAKKKWQAMEQEVASLRVQLASAQQEREQIMTELQTTIKQLNTEIKARQKAEALAQHFKTESTSNLWSAFGANAKVEICDRGTRKRHERCHEAVEAAMLPFQDKFKTCVDSYQAVPVLKQTEKKSDPLPAFAERLADDNKFTNKGWYIIFCDPSLPEAGANPDMGEEPSVEGPWGGSSGGTGGGTGAEAGGGSGAGTTTPTTGDDAGGTRTPSDD